jgi:SAM-dependent methyltransferase
MAGTDVQQLHRCPTIVVPEQVRAVATEQLGAYFEPLSKVSRHQLVDDFLKTSKFLQRAELLQSFTPLSGARLLEIGSGLGTNLACWIRHFNIDGYGIESGSEGFDSLFRASQLLFEANDIDPSRLIYAEGEDLPFDSESFDIVYSANVLEHTRDPERVIEEAMRVLRPGGVLHMEMPNYLSYLEGHYLVIQPPIVWPWMLPAYIRMRRRDPAFARTLNTQINPIWCERVVRRLKRRYKLTLLTLGEDVFKRRVAHGFRFETTAVASRLGGAVSLLGHLNVGNWVAHLIVALRGFYPIYLTVRKY